MIVKSFAEVIEQARHYGRRRLAVAGEPDEELSSALSDAASKKIADAVCYATAEEAVKSVRSDEADILMKGSVDTRAFMQAILNKEHGLRTGKLVSHIAVIEALGRMLLITDGGICLQPSLEEKVSIITNAIPVARALGIDVPKVAVLAATEKVNPKMPETVDAQKLSEMGIPGCQVQGPLAVDNAVSRSAAETKGIDGPVAGAADILLVPSVLVGNIFAKGIMYFADAPSGGVVAGTSAPVCFLSRADTAATKLNTIALGVLMSGA